MEDCKVVAALYIGETLSACGFKYSYEHGSNFKCIEWKKNEKFFPSSVLFNKNKNLHSCGYDAEEMYKGLCQNNSQRNWYMFRNLKRVLRINEAMEKATEMMDTDGKTMDTAVVFSSFLSFVERKFLDEVTKEDSSISRKDIQWIYTIPTDGQKDAELLLKSAAEMARIPRSRWTKLYDSMAFLTYITETQNLLDDLEPYLGIKVMLLQLDDYCLERSMYKVQYQNKVVVSEIFKDCKTTLNATKFSSGSMIHLAQHLFGQQLVDELQRKLPEEFQELIKTLRKKLPSGEKILRITTDLELRAILNDHLNGPKSGMKRHLFTFHADKLAIKTEDCLSFFNRNENKTLLDRYVSDICHERKTGEADIIVGFSESSFPFELEEALTQSFRSRIVRTFSGCGIQVIEGALRKNEDTLFQNPSSYLIVAAIDFGTTFSGCAFSTIAAPQEIFRSVWQGGGNLSLKTSSTVLLEPSGKMHSCGFQAEDQYIDLVDRNEHTDWFFFKNFKMLLYQNKTLKRNTIIYDKTDKPMEALTVFSALIRYLISHLLEKCSSQLVDIRESDLKWVITVPAIWNDGAKQFMREAAEKAGINPYQLSLVLEPEAASLLCKTEALEKKDDTIQEFQEGTQYVVLDCGGGTVDISVHEVLSGSTLRELYKANGGDWGGTKVDDAFFALLKEMFTEEVLEQMKEIEMEDYLSICREIEVKKRSVTPYSTNNLVLQLPFSIFGLFMNHTGMSFHNFMDGNTTWEDKVKVQKHKIKILPDFARELFSEPIRGILNHLSPVINHPNVTNIGRILMVGGFSESEMLQDAVKQQFPSLLIQIPNDPSLAVVKGAVLFGHNPDVVVSRICRFTYGIAVYRGGEPYFSVHLKEGDEIILGKPQQCHLYEPLYNDQTISEIQVYVAKHGVPESISSEDCHEIGNIRIHHARFKPALAVELLFGYIESFVRVKDQNSGKLMQAKFDFIG